MPLGRAQPPRSWADSWGAWRRLWGCRGWEQWGGWELEQRERGRGAEGGALSRVGAARSSGSAVGAVGSGCQGLDLASPVKTALRLAVGEEHTVGQTQGALLGDPHTRPGQRRWRPRQGVVKPLPSTCEAGGRSHGEPKAGGPGRSSGPRRPRHRPGLRLDGTHRRPYLAQRAASQTPGSLRDRFLSQLPQPLQTRRHAGLKARSTVAPPAPPPTSA